MFVSSFYAYPFFFNLYTVDLVSLLENCAELRSPLTALALDSVIQVICCSYCTEFSVL